MNAERSSEQLDYSLNWTPRIHISKCQIQFNWWRPHSGWLFQCVKGRRTGKKTFPQLCVRQFRIHCCQIRRSNNWSPANAVGLMSAKLLIFHFQWKTATRMPKFCFRFYYSKYYSQITFGWSLRWYVPQTQRTRTAWRLGQWTSDRWILFKRTLLSFVKQKAIVFGFIYPLDARRW